ncbi:uncharacterized protein PGTG_21937 [Puccinia graminis f. sp. tritici CRL 75-36-700-3]|uniref:Uncharacterized protein n=1 Tax=Puccinia graminis f. sp. tritici (strain CRL 75-36-700-3 / race SCCL) TaxID=418459 RepID=H6QSW4_PUCGT|nr:uncharacterized protein PGTG_21937 [Puccinia graminis f. sp. tritici CRL 75-36-700-3]EHS63918.1 hypothetical protein PGTG_21937 [Puccinia graminis f. sp. tritici CRL 75-36-700-3]
MALWETYSSSAKITCLIFLSKEASSKAQSTPVLSAESSVFENKPFKENNRPVAICNQYLCYQQLRCTRRSFEIEVGGFQKSLDQLIPCNLKPKFVVEEVQEATGVGDEKFGVVGPDRDPI